MTVLPEDLDSRRAFNGAECLVLARESEQAEVS